MIETPASDRAAMGSRGRVYAAAEFNRERLIDRLEHALFDAAGGPRRDDQ
jgi:hypothetical protein